MSITPSIRKTVNVLKEMSFCISLSILPPHTHTHPFQHVSWASWTRQTLENQIRDILGSSSWLQKVPLASSSSQGQH